MFDYLDKLRAKPVHVRQRIALFATATLSLFIAGVWIGTLNIKRVARTPSTVAEANTRSPWGVVSDMLKHTKGEMTAAVSDAAVQLEQVAAGSVAYDPSKDVVSTEDEEVSPQNGAIEDASAFPDTLGTGTESEVIHTRPGSLEEATGTISGEDMVQ